VRYQVEKIRKESIKHSKDDDRNEEEREKTKKQRTI
jgi:hypothetical protein